MTILFFGGMVIVPVPSATQKECNPLFVVSETKRLLKTLRYEYPRPLQWGALLYNVPHIFCYFFILCLPIKWKFMIAIMRSQTKFFIDGEGNRGFVVYASILPLYKSQTGKIKS